MNPATSRLRQLADAGRTTRYPCPCRAEGTVVELEPLLFSVTYRHDDWCPVLTDPANN